MIILMSQDHLPEHIDRVVGKIKTMGFTPHIIPGKNSVAIGITGNQGPIDTDEFASFPGVAESIKVTKPYKLAGREFSAEPMAITLKGHDVTFGEGHFVVMGGPCAVESYEQTLTIAKAVKERGAAVLRGGAYKPRTSPYSFQGLGLEGLKILRKVADEVELPIISEALDQQSLDYVHEYADIIQIGTRNMQNFSFLQQVGRTSKPVLLKRGFSATIDEWLMSAEYILSSGNPQVILCERGLRGFDPHTRNLLDITAVPVAKELSKLPVVIDPSHSTGRKSLVIPASRAALAIGAHGILVDVHHNPCEALVDGPQALLPEDFSELTAQLTAIATAMKVKMS